MSKKISFALTEEGSTLYPHLSKKTDGPFYCLACGSELILRRGNKNVPHFSHKHNEGNCSDNILDLELNDLIKSSGNNSNSGGGESLVHSTTKGLLSTYLEEFKYMDCCSICSKVMNSFVIEDPKLVSSEYQIGNYKCDLYVESGYSDNFVVFEIYFTHHVSTDKWKYFKSLPKCLIFEISAIDILNIGPDMKLKVKSESMCDSCIEKRKTTCIDCNKTFDMAETIIVADKRYSCFNCRKPCIQCVKGWTAKKGSTCKSCTDTCRSHVRNITRKSWDLDHIENGYRLFKNWTDKLPGKIHAHTNGELHHIQNLIHAKRLLVGKGNYPLNCPFSDKDKCKSAGAWWDTNKKCWFVRHIKNFRNCKQWIDPVEYDNILSYV